MKSFLAFIKTHAILVLIGGVVIALGVGVLVSQQFRTTLSQSLASTCDGIDSVNNREMYQNCVRYYAGYLCGDYGQVYDELTRQCISHEEYCQVDDKVWNTTTFQCDSHEAYCARTDQVYNYATRACDNQEKACRDRGGTYDFSARRCYMDGDQCDVAGAGVAGQFQSGICVPYSITLPGGNEGSSGDGGGASGIACVETSRSCQGNAVFQHCSNRAGDIIENCGSMECGLQNDIAVCRPVAPPVGDPVLAAAPDSHLECVNNTCSRVAGSSTDQDLCTPRNSSCGSVVQSIPATPAQPAGPAPASARSPVGATDNYTTLPLTLEGNVGTIPGNSVFGWAYDPDEPAKAIDVHIYFDGGPGACGAGCSGGAVTTNLQRVDVNRAYGITGNHGWAYVVPGQYRDGKEHTVNAYGIDSSGRATLNVSIGTKTFTVPRSPIGSNDGYTSLAQTLEGGTGTLPADSILGWAFDPNEPTKTIDVHVYFDGGPGCTNGCIGLAVPTNFERVDVNRAYGITGNHGFAVPVPAQYRDGREHTAYLFGIDSSGDGTMNSFIAQKNFTVVVAAAPPSILSGTPGDVDGNGTVNIFDYNILVSHFGQSGLAAGNGDLDGDGDVDIFDYNILVSNFGK